MQLGYLRNLKVGKEWGNDKKIFQEKKTKETEWEKAGLSGIWAGLAGWGKDPR